MTSSPSPTAQHPVSARFDLIDDDGRHVSARDYRGSFVLVFFGFTHCKMVCPRALSRLSETLDLLGPLADQIRPLYITVDPERDTPEIMKAFLQRDYPRFTGLTGTSAAIDDAKKSFRVFAKQVADPDDPTDYQVPHSAFTYLIGRDGQYVGHYSDAVEATDLAPRLAKVIAPSPADSP
jgi:protein SCO1